MTSIIGWLSVVLYVLLPGCSGGSSEDLRNDVTEKGGAQNQHTDLQINFEDFVGSTACKGCHVDVYTEWEKSTHAKAGGLPHADIIIGKFDGEERRFKDAILTPYVSDSGVYMFKLKTIGLPEQEFSVDGVIGGGHMIGGGTQTYFTRMQDGTFRMLPFDFIKNEQVWFGETSQGEGWIPINKDREIDKVSEWTPTRILGAHTIKQNCQECHGSQIDLNYSFEKKKYLTNFMSLDINCESCHGPAKRHVNLMQSGDPQEDIGMRSLEILDKDGSLNVCFNCHSLKNSLNPGFLPGKDLEVHYALKYPILTRKAYHPDGRIAEFGYQLNHLASDCYINGSMTCVSCHDPHSQGYRDINGVKLASAFDDGQCTSCHASKSLNTVEHSFHKIDSDGNNCVSCHMPYLQHPAIGNKLRFARSDHTIAIPRPEFDATLGLKSACKQCHEDKSVEYLQAKVDQWYGEVKPHNPTVAALTNYTNKLSRLEASESLLSDTTEHYMAQMTALSQFIVDHLSPNMSTLETEVVARLKQYAESPDLDVKSLAIAGLHLASGKDPEIRKYLNDQIQKYRGAKLKSRITHALPYFASLYEKKGMLDLAVDTYRITLDIDPQNVSAWTGMGINYSNMNRANEALDCFDRAIEIDNKHSSTWLNRGNVLRQIGKGEQAFVSYQKALELNPWDPHVYLSIGSIYSNQKDYKSAINSYLKAIEVEPSLSASYFYLASAYVKSEQLYKALSYAQAGLLLNPNDELGDQMIETIRKAIASN